MCEYAFPSADRDRLPQLLGVDIASLRPLDEAPVQRRASTYQRFEISVDDAKVVAVVGTRWMLPDHITILITNEPWRLFRIATWRRDKRLRLLLCDRLKAHGGCYVDHGRG